MIPEGTLVTVILTGEVGTVVGFIHRTMNATGRQHLILLVEFSPGSVRRFAPAQLVVNTQGITT